MPVYADQPDSSKSTRKNSTYRPVLLRTKKPRAQDLTGLNFGRLTVTAYAGTRKRFAYWNCVCACGNTHVAMGINLRGGRTLSCGCLRDEVEHRRFTADQVISMRVEYAAGKTTQEELAQKYRTVNSTIWNILRHKTWKKAGGPVTRSRRNKLTADDVRSVRKQYAKDKPLLRSLALKYGVTSEAISAVIRRKNWRHVA